MKLQEKIISLLTAALLLSANITSVSASVQAIQNPQAEIILEPKRTAEGIDYDVYIEHASSLSTLIFAMDFTSQEKGTMSLTDNACFDLLHSEWSNENQISLKAYLGRTGQKAGFSSDDKVKVAQISIPIDISEVGDVTATVTEAICAGILGTGGDASKGTVTVSEGTIKYTIRECSVLNVTNNKVAILSSKNRKADVIYVLYDDKGKLTNTYKESIDLNQGENIISANEAIFNKSVSISIMIWDSIDSMYPLAEKTSINNQNGD